MSRPGGRTSEHKATPAYLVKASSEGQVEAIVSVFGVLDDGRDIIHPGAFTKTISEHLGRMRVVDQHATDSVMRVIGKILSIREIGRAELPAEILQKFPSATGGLLTSTQYLMDTPEGRGVFDRIQAGAINEYSIGYEALDVDYSIVEQAGVKVRVRNIRTIKLWEFSPVIWGMNAATITVSAKASGDEDPTAETQPLDSVESVEPDEVTDEIADAKVMTGDGPVPLLGDSLTASLSRCFNEQVDWYLKCGLIERDQWLTLGTAFRAQLEAMYAAIPEVLALMPVGQGSYYYELSRTNEKAGRVLSTANASRIQNALDELSSVLRAAGIFDDITEDDEKSLASAGSDQPPTIEVDESQNIQQRARALLLRASLVAKS